MTYANSKEAIRFMDSLIHVYSRTSEPLYIDKIPETELEQLAAILISADPSLANEANGCDNGSFESQMLPALISHLKNNLDKDNAIEFMESWRVGIVDYLKPHIADLLQWRLQIYNMENVA